MVQRDGVRRSAVLTEVDTVRLHGAGVAETVSAGSAGCGRFAVGVHDAGDPALHGGRMQRRLTARALFALVLVERAALPTDHRVPLSDGSDDDAPSRRPAAMP